MDNQNEDSQKQRWKLMVEYDGRDFCGWQKQFDVISVQTALEEAIYNMSGERVETVAAGRTDSGVHALAQIVHFDLEKQMEPERVMRAINYHIQPHAAVVLSAEPVASDFHARFSAKSRSYIYRILCRPAYPVIDHGRVWWIKHNLDMKAMQEASKVLLGKHDFTSFRTVICQAKSPVKSIDEIVFSRKERDTGGYELEMFIKARSFLHHQVRNIIGTLKLVGEGKWTSDDVKKALEAKDRAAAGPTAPPDGLYFLDVDY